MRNQILDLQLARLLAIKCKKSTSHYPNLAIQVIMGYEMGVPGMCKGETRTLTVPPHLAYGDGGYPGNILHFSLMALFTTCIAHTA